MSYVENKTSVFFWSQERDTGQGLVALNYV